MNLKEIVLQLNECILNKPGYCHTVWVDGHLYHCMLYDNYFSVLKFENVPVTIFDFGYLKNKDLGFITYKDGVELHTLFSDISTEESYFQFYTLHNIEYTFNEVLELIKDIEYLFDCVDKKKINYNYGAIKRYNK